MGRLRLRPWPFGKSEEVELYWHGVPYLNSEGLWMLKCLFKRTNGSYKEQAFPFGTLPYLRIGQKYVDGSFSETIPIGALYEVMMLTSLNFEIGKGFDFPKSLYAFDKAPAPNYGNLPLCRFEVEGINYYIPCTEIVRSILTPYRAFANRILRPDGLSSFIESSYGYKDKLELKLTDEYNQKLLKDDVISYFVWLAFDKSAKKSWNSVYNNITLDAAQKSTGNHLEQLYKGVPIRVLPPLGNQSTWTFRGLEFKNHRLILELIHRSNLQPPYSIVEYSHPKLEKLESDKQPRYAKDSTKKPTDNSDVDLDITGQGSEQHPNNVQIEQPPISFSFTRKPRIIKNSKKTRRIHTGEVIVIGTKVGEEDTNTGTTQDWVQGGTIPQIEFSILNMVEASLAKGLEEFLRLIEYIKIHYKELSITFNIVPLPQLKSFSRYEDGSIRTCAIARIERQRHLPCYIIEVGRADGWSISTVIIKPVSSNYLDMKSFEDLINKLVKDLVVNNGHWEREFFRNENNFLFDTAKHISEQPIIRWAERIIEKI